MLTFYEIIKRLKDDLDLLDAYIVELEDTRDVDRIVLEELLMYRYRTAENLSFMQDTYMKMDSTMGELQGVKH